MQSIEVVERLFVRLQVLRRPRSKSFAQVGPASGLSASSHTSVAARWNALDAGNNECTSARRYHAIWLKRKL